MAEFDNLRLFDVKPNAQLGTLIGNHILAIMQIRFIAVDKVSYKLQARMRFQGTAYCFALAWISKPPLFLLCRPQGAAITGIVD